MPADIPGVCVGGGGEGGGGRAGMEGYSPYFVVRRRNAKIRPLTNFNFVLERERGGGTRCLPNSNNSNMFFFPTAF